MENSLIKEARLNYTMGVAEIELVNGEVINVGAYFADYEEIGVNISIKGMPEEYYEKNIYKVAE